MSRNHKTQLRCTVEEKNMAVGLFFFGLLIELIRP